MILFFLKSMKHSEPFEKYWGMKYDFVSDFKKTLAKEVCNRGVACSLLKLDGSWQATPSIKKFLNMSGFMDQERT